MKPIIFSTPMVRAILDSRKTQTRRVIKPQPNYNLRHGQTHKDLEPNILRRCPYGKPRESLYVREAWAWGKRFSVDYICRLETIPNPFPNYAEILYKADGDETGKWKPSIHMPKEAARLFLRIKDIRVERVQDISEEDAGEEGCEANYSWCESANGYENVWFAWEQFERLWDSINAKRGYSWESNPWVWCIEFEIQEEG